MIGYLELVIEKCFRESANLGVIFIIEYERVALLNFFFRTDVLVKKIIIVKIFCKRFFPVSFFNSLSTIEFDFYLNIDIALNTRSRNKILNRFNYHVSSVVNFSKEHPVFYETLRERESLLVLLLSLILEYAMNVSRLCGQYYSIVLGTLMKIDVD